MREVNNMEDILDSRDVIARRDELKEERERLKGELLDTCAECGRDMSPLEAWDEENCMELADLEAFIAEGSSSWEDGETLVRESYFQEYAQELAEDLGLIKKDVQWPYTCIDWEQAARELQYDYTGADFDGITYFYRS